MINVSPGVERMLRPLTEGPTKDWRGPRVRNVFSLTGARSTWSFLLARVHRKEMVLNCRIEMAVERVMRLVCKCWLANRGLFVRTRRYVNDGFACLSRLTFTWWRCCRLCLLTYTNWACPLFFDSALVSVSVFMAILTVFHSINFPNNSSFFHSVRLVFFCFTGPFNYIYIFMKVSLSFAIILCGWLGLKHQRTT